MATAVSDLPTDGEVVQHASTFVVGWARNPEKVQQCRRNILGSEARDLSMAKL